MIPPIEPRPHNELQRVIYDTHPWPLMGAASDAAIHEAGHVVVGLALGMPCHNARITPEGTAGRAGVFNPIGEKSITTTPPRPVEVAEIYQQTALVIWPGMPPAEAALNNAIMLVAGRQAELIHAGIRLTGALSMRDADHMQASSILLASGQRLAMCWAQRMARHLLTSAWVDVESIAAQLRATGTWTNPLPWVRQSSPSTAAGI